MKIQVYRISASSYQDPNFIAKEKKVLEGIEEVVYIQSLKEANPEHPFILITNTHTEVEKIPPILLENTILIVQPNSGHDNISLDFLKSAPCPILIGNTIRANAVAEYTLSCLFKHFTPIDNHYHWSSDRVWDRKLIRDQKTLIIGHGHIGELIFKSLNPLISQLQVVDPYKTNTTFIKTQLKPELFDDIDILIIASDLNPTTNKLIDANILKRLSKKVLIINPARGKIICENDLQNFLLQHSEAFCFLDVYEKEPFVAGFMADLQNLNKTSHIAGVYQKLNNDTISFEYILIKEFIESYRNENLSQFQDLYSDCFLLENRYRG